MFHRFLLIFSLTLTLQAGTLSAQDPIRFPRTPDISPDGKLVAFSYLGDIWTVETIGGIARPVTMHEAHEINPAFSPDGRQIAFSSNRFGSYDVFVVPAYGGKPTRLTFDSAQDMVVGWTPDGRSVLFTSNRGTSFPPSPELYAVSVDGGQERALPFREAKEAAFSANGQFVAFARGPGIWYRKGYRGSSNDDIWVAKADGSDVRRLTDFTGQDGSPMWSPDGRRLYYVSEALGNPANIVVQDLTAGLAPPLREGNPRLLTHHQDDAVRRARISTNGEWIVYECDGDLWVVSTRDGQSRKLAIEVHADDKANADHTTTFTKDMTEYALSPDEKHVAFAVHGDLFLMPIAGGKATRLTDTPAVEHGISWAPDGKKLLFVSDRGAQEDLYLLEADDPEHPEFTKAHRFKTKQLTNTPEVEFGGSFTPDGSRIAFIRAGKLVTMKPDGTDVKPLVDQTEVFDYDWSPDGKLVVYARADGSFASELYIVPLDGSQPPRNITRYATFNGDVSWSKTGNKLAFVSERRGAQGMFVMNLQKAALPGTPSSNDIDWDDIHLRVSRPGNNNAEGGTISPNGEMVAYASSGPDGSDLWVARTNGSGLVRLTTGTSRPRQIRWSKSSGTVYFLDGGGSLRTANPNAVAGPSSSMRGIFGLDGPGGGGGPGIINFSAKMTIRRDEEFAEMFAQSWRALSDHFYDAKLHDTNWRAVREKYQPLVKHIAMKEDLYAMVSLMLGELNASHLGINGPSHNADEITADLGLIYDESFKGPGLKIAEVLKRGPADRRGLNLKAGEIILSIDRTKLTDKTNLSQLLGGKVGETVLLEVTSDPSDSKAKRKIEMQAASREAVHNLMYQRWVERNAQQVAKLSNGTLGYIHIPSMDDAGMEQFVRSLYSDNFDKDAIVIDVRYNGGGFTHDQVLNYLGGKAHTLFRQRDGGEGLVLRSYDRKWTKPSIVLINNRSYSDAEIFPNAFRTLGLGKLVGQPTGGCVIGTSATRLIDGSQFRVPRTGVWTVKGINMEREGVAPDVTVDAQPEELAKGADPQLQKAVEVLTQDVIVWKKEHTPLAAQPEPPLKPLTPVRAPVPPTAPGGTPQPGATPPPSATPPPAIAPK
jgi:tricorn protease